MTGVSSSNFSEEAQPLIAISNSCLRISGKAVDIDCGRGVLNRRHEWLDGTVRIKKNRVRVAGGLGEGG